MEDACIETKSGGEVVVWPQAEGAREDQQRKTRGTYLPRKTSAQLSRGLRKISQPRPEARWVCSVLTVIEFLVTVMFQLVFQSSPVDPYLGSAALPLFKLQGHSSDHRGCLKIIYKL
jgi:hypothetical protein